MVHWWNKAVARRQHVDRFAVYLRLLLLGLTCVAWFGGMSGCGGNKEWTPGDKDSIRMVVAEISDARSNAEKLTSLFAEGSVPDKAWLKQSEKWSFVVETVEIDGTEATVEMAIENFYGEVVGTQTWTCIKSGDRGLLKDTPLPP